MTDSAEPPFKWRTVALSALLPTLLFSIGQGAIVPIIPAFAGDLGASIAVAGLIAAMLLVGQLIGDIPSGAVIARIGERTAMIAAAGLAVVGLLTAVFAPNPVVLAIGILLVGISSAAFALARHAFMTSFVPLHYRARALSTLGGTFRLGSFIGPFLGAGLIGLTGSSAIAFWVHIVATFGAVIALVVFPDPQTAFSSPAARGVNPGEAEVEQEARGLFRTIRSSARVLLTLGVGAALLSALRQARQVVLPVWAVSIGLDATTTSVIVGVAGAVDFSLFFLGGWMMDRFGRLWTVVPSALGLGLAHLVLAFTHDLAGAAIWFVAISIVAAIANGLGSGVLMTLGADLADRANPAPFLGAWRFTTDVGGASAPLLVAGTTAIASLSVAVGAIGVLGFVGAALLWRYAPRPPSR